MCSEEKVDGSFHGAVKVGAVRMAVDKLEFISETAAFLVSQMSTRQPDRVGMSVMRGS